MILYSYFRSSSAHRCRIALNLKEIEHEMRFVHLRKEGGQQKSDWFRRLNPQALVPALDTGEGILTQSLAIIEWLDSVYPEPALLPGDAVMRARTRAFSQIIACDIHPLQNLRVLEHLRSTGADQPVIDEWCRKWVGEGLAACERLLSDRPLFCFGDTPTLADVCLVPQIYSARRFEVDISVFPKLAGVFERCMQLKAFIDAAPEHQRDFE